MRYHFGTNYRVLALLIAGGVLAGSFFAIGQLPDRMTYGAMTRMVSDVSTTPATALIAIDDESLRRYGDWPWSRERLAAIVARLADADPAAIGITIPLDTPQHFPEGKQIAAALAHLKPSVRSQMSGLLDTLDSDAALSRAIDRARRVVLAAPVQAAGRGALIDAPALKAYELRHSRDPGKTGLPGALLAYAARLAGIPFDTSVTAIPPLSRFTHAAAATAPWPPALGSNVVSEPLIMVDGDRMFATFSLQLAASALGTPSDALEWDPLHGIRMGSTRIATDAAGYFYPVPAADAQGHAQLPTFSAVALLNGQVPAKALRNKAVVVGLTAAAVAPESSGLGRILMTPAEWAAFTVDAVLAGRSMYTPLGAYGVQRIVIIALALYLCLLPRRFHALSGVGISSIVALLLLNAELLLMVTRQWFMPLALPSIFVVGTHLVLYARHSILTGIDNLRRATVKAYRELAENYQSQGRIDDAVACLDRCPADPAAIALLYDLGQDLERRRQFSKAASVYDRIAAVSPGYRDCEERRVRLRSLVEAFPHSTGPTSAGATLLIDEATIARPLIGRYVIEREIGRGAMGMVYVGTDPRIGRKVAIKTLALTEEFSGQQLAEIRTRFYREAETAGQLSHPNIVTIYDVGEEHDLAYIAMDFIEGESLESFTQPGCLLSMPEVFQIGAQVADALDYAHQHKVVHRDIKPANILYNRETGVLKVTDFGIACLTDHSRTRTGTVLGSPCYMSPEQLAGGRVDGRSDLFSLGVTLFELFCGQLPFNGDSVAALSHQITNEKQQNMRKLRPDLPSCSVKVVNRMLEKKAAKRFQTGAELAAALRDCSTSCRGGRRARSAA